MSVTEIIEAVRAMSDEEQAKVCAALLDLRQNKISDAVRVRERLYTAGLLSASEPPQRDLTPRHPPLDIKGQPLSEMIIEERR